MDDALRMNDDLDTFISTPKSQCASIISRPLLNNVAESMVIFGPIFQVGCFNACSGVIESNLLAAFRGTGRPTR
jgi:hypothetical protein